MSVKISVITTVLNCENYISKSIQSIIEQTNGDFEYIIVNDGSTDRTGEIIHKFAGIDKRLIVIDNKKNEGRVKSLNTALSRAKGKYIAVHDADDISLPERLEKQSEFLEKNQEYVLAGSHIKVIDEDEKIIYTPQRPVTNEETKFSLLFRCTFANPSIMYRRETLEKYKIRYEEDFIHAEDFRIISLIARHGKLYNLRDKLVLYRKHPSNNSVVNFGILNDVSSKIVMDNIANIGIDVSHDEALRIRKLMSSKGMDSSFVYKDVELIFRIVKKFNKKKDVKGNTEITKTLKRMLNWLGKKNTITNPKYSALYVSILTYKLKQSIFVKNRYSTHNLNLPIL
ncbi:MAG: glycosyltransferase family 2 protein [bacterium]